MPELRAVLGSVRVLSWLVFGCIPAVLLSCWWQQLNGIGAFFGSKALGRCLLD